MFTFSDGGDPQAYEAVKAAEIPMRERNRFRFNNSAIWSKEIDDLTNQFWTLGMENFENFCLFIKDEDKTPVSLSLTSQVLDKRKLIEEEGFKAKRHSQLLIKKQMEIAKSIMEAKANVDMINQHKNFTKVEVRSGYE